jgi:hypothetical protein
VQQNRPAAAAAAFVDAFDAPALAVAAVMFVVATVILAWPARRAEVAQQPAPTQGAAT